MYSTVLEVIGSQINGLKSFFWVVSIHLLGEKQFIIRIYEKCEIIKKIKNQNISYIYLEEPCLINLNNFRR